MADNQLHAVAKMKAVCSMGMTIPSENAMEDFCRTHLPGAIDTMK